MPGRATEQVGEALVSAHRLGWTRDLARLASRYRDLDLAEEALAGAYEAAVRTWPTDGVPDNPGGWIRTVAERRALDVVRRRSTAARHVPHLGTATALVEQRSGRPPHLADRIGDERLQLVLACTHPALNDLDQLALALRCVAGLSTHQVARLLLATPDAMAARLKRARHKAASLPGAFAVPDHDELADRLPHALRCAYLVFTEGYAPTTGSDTDPDLMDEGLRLARLLLELAPRHRPAQALLALLLLQSSRRDARTDAAGQQVLLADQDRGRWRRHEAEEAHALLDALRDAEPEPYLLQALVARELMAQHPRWDDVDRLLLALARLEPSPLVTVHRAVVVAERDGPGAGLHLLERVREDLSRHPLLHAARADLLARLPEADHGDEAVAEYEQAIELSDNDFRIDAWRRAIERLRSTRSG